MTPVAGAGEFVVSLIAGRHAYFPILPLTARYHYL
jgi:hypothetical protein